MGEVFYWLFNMSIAASLTGIVIALVRRFRRIPRRVAVILWIIPFLRFWFPFGIGSRYGLMTLLSRFTTRTVPVYEGTLVSFSFTNSLMAANSYFPITYKVDLLAGIFEIAAVVWAVLAGAIVIAMAALCFATLSELKTADRLRGRVYLSHKVVSPAVYGIFRPRIVIPASASDSADFDLILLHEERHIRRLDNLWRIVAFLTAALHWFNPLAWLFLKLFLSDLELACDESTLSRLPADEKKRYAHALLNAQENKTLFASAFGGAKIRTRIEHILSFRKMTAVSAVGSAIFAAVIAYVLLTNAA